MISLLLGVVTVALVFYLVLKRGTKNYGEFKKQGLKYVKPIPFIGNSQYLFTSNSIGKVVSHYKDFPSEKVIGMFELSTPVYFLRCPELIKHLTIRDFQYFQDHALTIESSPDELFSNVLFAMKQNHWRVMRLALTPMFTPNKMRTMLDLIMTCNRQLENFLKKEYEEKGLQSYSIKDLLTRYTNDVIASCAYGMECDSFKNPNNEVYYVGRKLLELQQPRQTIKFMLTKIIFKLKRLLGFKIMKSEMKKKFFELIMNTMAIRKRENIFRPDMLQLLMNLKSASENGENTSQNIHDGKVLNGEEKRNWTDTELAAQCYMFFVAGYDTTSTVTSFMAYELAVNPKIQEKLITEIDKTNASLGGAPLNYEALKSMKYLQNVCSEVLRKWPPAVFADRKCVRDYTYEGSDGLRFTVKKDNLLWIPIYALQMDPQYFPNPEKFDPDRFNDENKSKNNMSAYLPFGIGPRNCIGMRFALMEMEALFYHLLLNFRIKVNKDTQVPVKLKTSIQLLPEKDICLSFEPRNNHD